MNNEVLKIIYLRNQFFFLKEIYSTFCEHKTNLHILFVDLKHVNDNKIIY